MKNNKGLSYVELLIVIAIMVLLTGVSALSMGLANRTNAVKTADKLVTSLKTARTYSLAKGSVKGAFHIRKQGNNYQCAVGDLADNPEFETIGTYPVTISYMNNSGDVVPIEAATGTVTITFAQSSGSVVSNSLGMDGMFLIEKFDEDIALVRVGTLTGKCEMTLY